MWVGALDTQGHFSSYDASPRRGFFYDSFRIGDYSTVVIDPTDGTTFWAANEYSGPDAATDIWRTHITSFSLPPAVNNDWYSINVAAGNSLVLAVIHAVGPGRPVHQHRRRSTSSSTTPSATWSPSAPCSPDGRNEALFYNAPITGQYFVHVFNNPGTSGEYFLQVNTAAVPVGRHLRPGLQRPQRQRRPGSW